MADYQSVYTGPQIDSAIAAGLELRNDPQLALANLGARPNQNIARNPDFRINQRNFTSDNWTSGYGPDGWRAAGSGHLEYSGGAVKTANQYLLQFYAPGEIKAGTYTISALCTDNIMVIFGNWGGSALQRTSTNYDSGLASVTFDVAADFIDDSKNQYIYVMCENSGTISHIKFEKSPFQTLACKDSSGNWTQLEEIDYGAELALCQRQLYIPALSTLSTYYYASVVPTSGDIFFPIILPVPMRATPAITVIQATLYVGGDSKTVGPNVTCYDLRGNQVMCRANGVATGASARTGIVEIGGLQLSAEL